MSWKLPFVKDDPAHYDNVTGLELPQHAEEQAKQVHEEKLREAQDYISLSQNPGWIRMKEEIQFVLKEAQEKLLHSRNNDYTRNLQEFILARRSLLREVEGRISEGKSLLEEQVSHKD